MNLNEKDQDIISSFNELNDWEDRYRRIIDIGKENPGLAEDLKIEDLKVKGCQSQVWIHCQLKDGKIQIQADSDAMIVKGLVTLLSQLFNNERPEDIISYQPQFISKLGFSNHLSPSRNNGLLNMLKQIKFYAIAFQAQAQAQN